MLTFTHVGDDWPVIRSRMNQLRKILQRSGYLLEWAYVVECNFTESRHFHHVHALAHGDVPDGGTLTEHAQRVGFGPVTDVKALRDVKASARYLFKDQPRWRHYLRHTLYINGGQLVHASRGYWRVSARPVGSMGRTLRECRATRSVSGGR
jgi:hypothetical protein